MIKSQESSQKNVPNATQTTTRTKDNEDNKEFIELNDISHKNLLHAIKVEYIQERLHNIHPGQNGKLPKAYCNVKNKDNSKSRLI